MFWDVWGPSVRQIGGRPLAFWAVFDDFHLPRTPPDTPNPLDGLLLVHLTLLYEWNNFYIGLVHVWGHFKGHISTSKKRADLKFGNPLCRHPMDHISKFQIDSFFRSWDLTPKMTSDMYQTNIKVVHLLEESPMKQSELIQSIGLVQGGHRKLKIIKNEQKKKSPFLRKNPLRKPL